MAKFKDFQGLENVVGLAVVVGVDIVVGGVVRGAVGVGVAR